MEAEKLLQNVGRARSEPGGTRWRTGGEVKGNLAKGVGSQYSHATSERDISSITQADAHTSAASSRLNWHPHRFKWTRPFQGKTKSGFCACAITFRTSYTRTRVYTGEIFNLHSVVQWRYRVGVFCLANVREVFTVFLLDLSDWAKTPCWYTVEFYRKPNREL